MRARDHLMWLAHVFPAVALTITAPVQTTPSSIPVSECSSVNLIEDVSFETIDVDDSVWTVLPPQGGVVVDGYLHLSSEAIQSQTLLAQTVTGAIAEEQYTFSLDFRQTAGADDDGTTCTVDVMLNGEDFDSSVHKAGSWKTVSKQWTGAASEVDFFVVIDCPNAVASDTTVDVKNISLKKPCGSSETSTSLPIQTPSLPVSPSGQPTAPEPSSSINTVTVSIPSSHSSSVQVSPVSPSSTTSPLTLTTTISGPTNTASTSAIKSSTSISASVKPTNSPPVTTSPPEMTTSTIYTTRTSTITACPSTVTHCPASEQTTYTTTETIVVSTTICPVEDTTATAEEPSPTGPSDHGNDNGSGSDSGHDSGSENDHTVSTIHSTRTIILTECPATVTDCPARDQTTRVTTETIVAGTTSVPINAAVTTTAPGTAQTTVPPVSENENGNDSGVSEGEGSTGSNSGSADETETETGPGVVSEVDADSDTETGTDTDSGAGSESSGSDVSAGHDAGHVSHPGAAHGSTSIPYFSLSRIGSATVKVPVAASSPTANADAGAGQGAGTSTESGNLPSASPVFNGASSFAVSSVVSAVGAVAALAFFL